MSLCSILNFSLFALLVLVVVEEVYFFFLIIIALELPQSLMEVLEPSLMSID